MVGLMPCSIDDANDLLVAWGHRLGPCNRPFGQIGYVLEFLGVPVSVAISASTVSDTVAGFRRMDVVECARQCSDPAESWASRIMIRLWRQVCAPKWPYWPVKAGISYSKNSMHSGNLYRFDGWEKVSDDCGFVSGSNYGRGVEDYPAAGKKTLWIWRYAESQCEGDAA